MAESMDEPLPGSWWRHRKGGHVAHLTLAVMQGYCPMGHRHG